jgi:carotenoid cleavage dioxygenase-like enzyme
MIQGLEKAFLDVYTFQADESGIQGRTRVAKLPFDKSPYLHSFGVTDNYVILPINQQMGMPNTARPILLGAITDTWMGIYVVDDNGNALGPYDTDPFVHVHIINSYEVHNADETLLIMDLGAYPSTPFAKSGAMDIPMMLNKTERDSNPLKADLRRYTIPISGPNAGKVTYRSLGQSPGSHNDFYRVNPKFKGKEYCIFYATEWWHDGSNYANMAILKHNICENTMEYWTKTHVYPGEAMMIPGNSEEEDDGVLVFVALDGERGATNFVTLDAKTMTEIDNTLVQLPLHIPFTAHGEFLPSTQEAVVAV